MVQDITKGVVFWNDNKKRYGGFSASNSFDKSLLPSVEAKDNAAKRIKLESKQLKDQPKLSGNFSPLGLTLRKSPSFINLLETKLNQAHTNQSTGNEKKRERKNDVQSQFMTEKIKASNFPASLLRIGTWEVVSRYEGDLVAKCYYAKRKLAWEVLYQGLKSKIEVQWSDIAALRGIFRENEPGILEIELNHPPLFFRETDPQPRKHTLWQTTSDFTGGQAPICRIHHLQFPEGTLEKHYEKLKKYDHHMHMLSHGPFPTFKSPYFHTSLSGYEDLPFEFDGHASEFLPSLQFPRHSIPRPNIVPTVQNSTEQLIRSLSGAYDSNSLLSDINLPLIQGSCHGIEYMRNPIQLMGLNHKENIPMRRGDQLVGLPLIAQAEQIGPFISPMESCHPLTPSPLNSSELSPSSNWGIPMRRGDQLVGLPLIAQAEQIGPFISPMESCYPLTPSPLNSSEVSPSSNWGISEIADHLLHDTLVECSEEERLMAKVNSMNSLLVINESSPMEAFGLEHSEYSLGSDPSDPMDLRSIEQPIEGSGILCSQPLTWLPAEESIQNLLMHLPGNISYPYTLLDPSMEDFAAGNIAAHGR